MPTDMFEKRKKDIFEKEDKSSKGDWDKKIISLCEKINKSKNYYSTSSCSGRIVLIYDSNKKTHGLFLHVTHDKINPSVLKEILKKILKNSKNLLIIFKQEPCGLHVACRNLKDAQNLLTKAKKVGWKKSGIISSEKRFVVEMFGTGKLEFPLIQNKKVLVDNNFLEIALKKANENLEKSWKIISQLEKVI